MRLLLSQGKNEQTLKSEWIYVEKVNISRRAWKIFMQKVALTKTHFVLHNSTAKYHHIGSNQVGFIHKNREMFIFVHICSGKSERHVLQRDPSWAGGNKFDRIEASEQIRIFLFTDICI